MWRSKAEVTCREIEGRVQLGCIYYIILWEYRAREQGRYDEYNNYFFHIISLFGNNLGKDKGLSFLHKII